MSQFLSDKDKLKMFVESTIEDKFGSICDSIRNFVQKGDVSQKMGEILVKFVRNKGNYAIRIVNDHIDHNHIVHK